MSIHKSQGQTLHRVKVDLGKVFERGECCRLDGEIPCFNSFLQHTGQSYVALSRASSTEGLQVVGFNPKKVNTLILPVLDSKHIFIRSWHTLKLSNGTRRWNRGLVVWKLASSLECGITIWTFLFLTFSTLLTASPMSYTYSY